MDPLYHYSLDLKIFKQNETLLFTQDVLKCSVYSRLVGNTLCMTNLRRPQCKLFRMVNSACKVIDLRYYEQKNLCNGTRNEVFVKLSPAIYILYVPL